MSASVVSNGHRDFVGRVESWITEQLGEQQHSFGSLTAALPGVDPIVVAAALRELAEGSADLHGPAVALLDNARNQPPTTMATLERPIPHPLDFYWAHTPQSIDRLVGEIAAFTQAGATIAYLGTPNIFSAAATGLGDRTHVLLDRSVPRTAALRKGPGRVLRIDLIREELPELAAAAAVVDPPWYPDHMRSFLWAAARVIAVGAVVWASFPPVGTRSTVEQETSAVIEWAAQAGLELVERRPDAFRYRSSPFELAAHRAAGLGGIPLDWRCAELIRLRLRQLMAHSRPPAPRDEFHWLPFVIEEIPIWVRERQPVHDSIRNELLVSVVEGDVLQTVSRRDPIRQRVDVWTSLNRVWASSHPPALQAVSRALAEREDPIAAVEADLARRLEITEREHVRAAADHLSQIVRRERGEHGL